jgi:cephalosporin hydroxylase
MADLPFDAAASVTAMNRQNAGGATKITEDLDRYSRILASTRPDVIVECGTWRGGSAQWFAGQGFPVVTIDIDATIIASGVREQPLITCLTGDSVAPAMVSAVEELVSGKRVMVVLDSDHSPHHVRREIESYGPLVSAGCYLVVEDTILRWFHSTPGPLDAVEYLLQGNPEWQRDEEIEHLHPVSMHPSGWWIRRAQ